MTVVNMKYIAPLLIMGVGMLAALYFVQDEIAGNISITPGTTLDDRVTDGRTAVEAYRTINSSPKYTQREKSEALVTLYNALGAAGYTEEAPHLRIDDFFLENDEKNAKDLGFTDHKDYLENATSTSIQNFRDSWK